MSVTITTTPVLVTLDTELQSTVITVSSVSVNVSNQFPENPILNSIAFDTTPVNVPETTGTLKWSEEDRSLELNIGNGVALTLNEELPIDLLNKLGSQIDNGKLVYTSGAQGNRATAGYASNTTCATASKTIAMATENIPNNQRGKCTTIGRVKGLNTQGIPEGTELWLGTNGDWTAVKPPIGTARVRIGIVIKEHVSDGWVFVWIQQDKYMFGDRDGGNYSVFDDNGYLEHLGLGKPFEDLNFDVANTGGPAAFVPDLVRINNVDYREFTSANNQSCCGSKEIYHAAYITTGQSLVAHAHVFLKSGESAGTTGVRYTAYWELRQGAATTNGSVELSATSAQLTANPHKLDLYAAIGFTGPTTLGGQLTMRLARTGGNAGDVVAITYGVHVALDSGGSKTATSK